MTETPASWTQAVALLAEEGLEPEDRAYTRLARHAELIREWNRRVSLVSAGDLDRLWERHIVDSVSLAPWVARSGRVLLDIGSGAGFPAIPLACVVPGLQVILLERSVRKIGFLRKVVGALQLEGVRIIEGAFPANAAELRPDVVTARAVERPERIVGDMKRFLGAGMVFLAQFGGIVEELGSMFHVEPIEDAWTRAGLRRGALHRVTRRTS